MEHNYFWKTLVYDFESHTGVFQEIVNAADRNSLNLYKNAQFSFSRIKQMEMPKLKATGRSRQRRINQLFLQVK
jgi:hypothetical protein